MGEVMNSIRSLFLIVADLSLVGSYVFSFVLLARLAFCKAPRWCSYLLWAIVFVRLICPVFPEGRFSLIPEQLQVQIENHEAGKLTSQGEPEAVEMQTGQMLTPQNNLLKKQDGGQQVQSEQTGWQGSIEESNGIGGNNGIEGSDGAASQSGAVLQQPRYSAGGVLIDFFSVVWFVGMVLLAGYHVVTYWRFRMRVRGAVCRVPGIYEIEGEHLSFVLGIFKPAIYLSSGLDEESRRVVLCHEQVHLHRKDYVIKPLALGICCVHWFNPLAWLAFYLMNRDCEMSCDEKVVALLGEGSKKVYSYALLDEATGGEGRKYRHGSVCALLSFGEDSVKTRIRHILQYKKASVWIMVCAVVVLVVLVVGLCRNPAKPSITDEERDRQVWDAWEKGGRSMVPWAQEAYVENGEIVCIFSDNQVTFDVTTQAFGGEAQKKYTFYYEESYFKPYIGHELSRQEFIDDYTNGAELLAGLEELFPEGQFQYIARENGLVHVNVAYRLSSYENVIRFWNVTYEVSGENEEKELAALEQSDGCYRLNIINGNEEPFVERIAGEYGWQSADSMASSRMTPEAALDAYAFAYKSRNGNALYQLSFDKENFRNWDMVTPLEDGSFAFGGSSPWVSHYSIDYPAGKEEATIRFYLTDSVPEVYIAEETVRVVKDGELYCVDHVDYVSYDRLDTLDEVKQVYDLDSATRFYNPFGSETTGLSQGDVRTIFSHLLEGTNPEYYSRYTDPVTAAKAYLHLGEGTGEVTEVKYAARPQNMLNNGLDEGTIINARYMGEGTIVNVRYTFAQDGSTMDIPMTLAEESMNVWALCFTTDFDIERNVTEKIGGATHVNSSVLVGSNARIVYSICTPEEGTLYQVSSFGLYKVDEKGIQCIYNHYMLPSTQLTYYDGKLYFPTDSQYYDGAPLDWMNDKMCVLDPKTEMVSYVPLEQFEAPWEGAEESSAELSVEEKNKQGIHNRQLILENPNTIYEWTDTLPGQESTGKIEVLIDMDGDGTTEEICMEITEGTESYYGPWDNYKLSAGEGFEYRKGENQVGSILAFSPDGKRIYIALHEEGPSGDPLTTLFKYEDNRLRKAGTFDNDIRTCTLEDGIISTFSGNWVVQTDWIYVQYRMNEQGNLEKIPQETYTYYRAGDEEITQPKLLVNLPLHTAPDSDEAFVLAPQTVRFLEVHQSNSWVLVEGEDGQRGWMQVEDGMAVELDKVLMEVFEGLNMAG